MAGVQVLACVYFLCDVTGGVQREIRTVTCCTLFAFLKMKEGLVKQNMNYSGKYNICENVYVS